MPKSASIRVSAVLVAALVILFTVAPAPAGADPVLGELPSVQLWTPADLKCLDADAYAGWNGTKGQLWDCNAQPQQTWYMRPDPDYSG